jgi:16S rRNA (cytosine1402-N4)-methyltransferase
MPEHVPVLLRQVVSWLQPEQGGVFVDCTVGLGGHAAALLAAGAGRLIGLDRDPDALAVAHVRLAAWGPRVSLVHADYRDLPRVLDAEGVLAADGIVADLGVSSLQLDTPGRGFSFRHDEPLDMRMDRSRGPDAAAWLQDIGEDDLADVLRRYGDERFAKRIARAIVLARATTPITRTGELAAIVRRAIPRRGWQRIDPATRTFQAIRVAVNRELEGLETFLVSALWRLRVGARLAVIAFHSLEDRCVKRTLRAAAQQGTGATVFGDRTAAPAVRVLTKKPITPDEEETARNPRARSAKLRVAERTE